MWAPVCALRHVYACLGLHSPLGPGGTGGSGGFSSSSLNALQAISEGVGSSSLTPPTHRPDGSPGTSASPPQQSRASRSPEPHPSAPTPPPGPDGQAAQHREASEAAPASAEAPARRLPDSKGHRKLLQLLTSPTEDLTVTGAASPPSASVSSSSSAGAGPAGQGGASSSSAAATGPSAHFNHPLQEKHKILHKLLQNGNTPDEVARITAEATGKAMGVQEPGGAEAGQGGVAGVKQQEQHSPKKEKPHVLLHYLLKDDSKKAEPKLEELENKAGPEGQESKIKAEPPDEVTQNRSPNQLTHDLPPVTPRVCD